MNGEVGDRIGVMSILAGDIGGTKTRLALFEADDEKRLKPVDEKIFTSRDYAGLEKILQEWLSGRSRSIRVACFGVAGPVVNGRCETTNLAWIVDADQISQQFGVASVVLLNDLEATAYGTSYLSEKELCTLNPGQSQPHGNRCVIAAGTGLGEAILFWDGSRYRASASEGGHADFAPRNSTEMRLLEYLLRHYPRVSYERVLSGPGLFNIYRFMKDTAPGEEPPWLSQRLTTEDPGAVISEVALAGKSDLCVKALDLFVSVYGAAAGNLALTAMTTGGVYIGGGIGPKILEKLFDGAFMKAFLDKGRFASFMDRIPVRVILNEKAALLGAARFGLHQQEG